MTSRTFKHAVTRVWGFWIPLVIGGALAFTGTSLIAGGILGGVAFFNLLRVTSKRGLHEKLLFEDDKQAHGVKRRLKTSERRLLDELSRYCQQLREVALDPDLAKQTWEKSWALVRTASGQDSTKDLQRFFNSLPALEGTAGDEEVTARIQKDLEHRRKIDRELDLL